MKYTLMVSSEKGAFLFFPAAIFERFWIGQSEFCSKMDPLSSNYFISSFFVRATGFSAFVVDDDDDIDVDADEVRTLLFKCSSLPLCRGAAKFFLFRCLVAKSNSFSSSQIRPILSPHIVDLTDSNPPPYLFFEVKSISIAAAAAV